MLIRRKGNQSPTTTSQMDEKKSNRDNSTFTKLLLSSQIFGLLLIVLTFVYISEYLGGFNWTEPKKRFNFHPICMVIGMVYFAGNSLLAFRVFNKQPKPIVKLIHASIHVSAFTISLFGSIAVFSFHLELNIPNLYSLHSWLGATTMTLFFLQYVGSFYSFLYPTASSQFRSTLLPYHVLGGFYIFGLSIVSCLTGFTEKALFDQINKYSAFSGATFLINFCGIFMTVYACLIIYLVTEKKFKRKFVGEQIPLTHEMSDSVQIQETK